MRKPSATVTRLAGPATAPIGGPMDGWPACLVPPDVGPPPPPGVPAATSKRPSVVVGGVRPPPASGRVAPASPAICAVLPQSARRTVATAVATTTGNQPRWRDVVI